MLSWSYNSPGFFAASQQTLFIVSGSPSNPILGEVNQMLCWGHNSPGGGYAASQQTFYCLQLPFKLLLGEMTKKPTGLDLSPSISRFNKTPKNQHRKKAVLPFYL